jgi:hypothetical protein
MRLGALLVAMAVASSAAAQSEPYRNPRAFATSWRA